MFGAFRKLFGTQKAADALPSSQSPESLLRQLGQLDIYVIAEMQSDGIDPTGMTKEQLLEKILASKDMSERQNFRPFVYDSDGLRRLPFFTDMQHVENFIGEYSKQQTGSSRSRCWGSRELCSDMCLLHVMFW